MIRFRVKKLHRFTTEETGTYGYPNDSSVSSNSGASVELEAVTESFEPGSRQPSTIHLPVTEDEAKGFKTGSWYTLVAVGE